MLRGRHDHRHIVWVLVGHIAKVVHVGVGGLGGCRVVVVVGPYPRISAFRGGFVESGQPCRIRGNLLSCWGTRSRLYADVDREPASCGAMTPMTLYMRSVTSFVGMPGARYMRAVVMWWWQLSGSVSV